MTTKPPTDPEAKALHLERFLPYRLNVVGTLGGRALGRIYGEHFGIGIPEWRVVAQLGEFGKLTSRDIGELAQMHKTKVSRAVGELEKRGLVSRAENRQDRRESFVAPTPAGKRLYPPDRAISPETIARKTGLSSSLSPLRSSRTSREAAPIRDPCRNVSDEGSGMDPGSPLRFARDDMSRVSDSAEFPRNTAPGCA